MPKTKAKNTEKRLRKLERQVAINKAELKCHGAHQKEIALGLDSLYTVKIDTIPQGTAVNERIGNNIKIHKVEIQFWTDKPLIDWFLIKSNDGATLIKDDFIDARYTMPKTYTHGNYQVLRHYCSAQAYDFTTGGFMGPVGTKWVWRPRYPLTINYETASGGTGTQPAIYLMCLNKNPFAAVTLSYVAKVWFSDA